MSQSRIQTKLVKWFRILREAQPLLRRPFRAVIPALGRRRQDNLNFEATFGYVTRSRETLVTGNTIQKYNKAKPKRYSNSSAVWS